jgi:plasmid stabilization system protein ParE
VTLEWTPRAARQLSEQLKFIARDKPSAADRMAEIIEQTTSLLLTLPNMGKVGKLPRSREFAVPNTPFIIVYRHTPDRLTIIHIRHGAQKPLT